jgi:hypothetical protein
LRTHAATAHLVTLARVSVRRVRDSFTAPMRASPEHQLEAATGSGRSAMFDDDLATTIRVLAGCVLGGCFAIAVIVGTAIG